MLSRPVLWSRRHPTLALSLGEQEPNDGAHPTLTLRGALGEIIVHRVPFDPATATALAHSRAAPVGSARARDQAPQRHGIVRAGGMTLC